MELMSRYPDKHFDLAVCDPEYGINVITGRSFGDPLRKDGTIRHGVDKRNGAKIIRKASTYKKKNWDASPATPEYFKELFRVSKNQIVFGANHFISRMPFDSSGWIVWDKINDGNDYADCEMAWTSFKKATRLFRFMWNGMLQGSSANGKALEGDISKREKRIHPTQKPVALYKWIFKNYAKPGDKILDTHLGSGSIAIALDSMNKIEKMNLTLTACEIDKEYFDDAIKRIKKETAQMSIFEPE